MPYVSRSDAGEIIAVAVEADARCQEFVESCDPALRQFFDALGAGAGSLDSTDQDFIRVLEDVVDLLIGKGVILFTELPESAQAKILKRQDLRSRLGGSLELLGDD